MRSLPLICLAFAALLCGSLAWSAADDLAIEADRRALNAGGGAGLHDWPIEAFEHRSPGLWSDGHRFDFGAAMLLTGSLTGDPAAADRFAQAEALAERAIHRAPANALYWFRLAAARHGAGDDRAAADALAMSFAWSPALDDAAIARLRLSARLWTLLTEEQRRAALQELRILAQDPRLVLALADSFEEFPAGFRPTVVASIPAEFRRFFIRRLRRNAATSANS